MSLAHRVVEPPIDVEPCAAVAVERAQGVGHLAPGGSVDSPSLSPSRINSPANAVAANDSTQQQQQQQQQHTSLNDNLKSLGKFFRRDGRG